MSVIIYSDEIKINLNTVVICLPERKWKLWFSDIMKFSHLKQTIVTPVNDVREFNYYFYMELHH